MEILYPAYGRSYTSWLKAYTDWHIGKDFRLGEDGPYCSIRDAEHLPADLFFSLSNFRIVPL
jgi:hypothetical protein